MSQHASMFSFQTAKFYSTTISTVIKVSTTTQLLSLYNVNRQHFTSNYNYYYFLVRTFVVHLQAVKRSQEPFLFVYTSFVSSIFDLVCSDILRHAYRETTSCFSSCLPLYVQKGRFVISVRNCLTCTFPDNAVKRFVNYMPITCTRGADNRYFTLIILFKKFKIT